MPLFVRGVLSRTPAKGMPDYYEGKLQTLKAILAFAE